MKNSEETKRKNYIPNITMLTAEETGEALLTTAAKIHMLRNCGLLRGIKTGKSWMFSQSEILRFQNEMIGLDLSSTAAIERVLHERTLA